MRILSERHAEEAFVANRMKEVLNYFYIYPLFGRNKVVDLGLKLIHPLPI